MSALSEDPADAKRRLIRATASIAGAVAAANNDPIGAIKGGRRSLLP
jgi:H+/Cl- antiporter ClcA